MCAIPAAWEMEIGGLWVKVSLNKKLVKSYFNKQAGSGGNDYGPSYTVRRSEVQNGHR
jgi:hypothetical protein